MSYREKPYLLVDGGRSTICEHLKLYRAGRVGPLTYSNARVEIVICRLCGVSRLDDGTPCQACGAYKHCAYQPPGSKSTLEETEAFITAVTTRRVGRPPNTKATNPRRNKRNAS